MYVMDIWSYDINNDKINLPPYLAAELRQDVITFRNIEKDVPLHQACNNTPYRV